MERGVRAPPRGRDAPGAPTGVVADPRRQLRDGAPTRRGATNGATAGRDPVPVLGERRRMAQRLGRHTTSRAVRQQRHLHGLRARRLDRRRPAVRRPTCAASNAVAPYGPVGTPTRRRVGERHRASTLQLVGARRQRPRHRDEINIDGGGLAGRRAQRQRVPTTTATARRTRSRCARQDAAGQSLIASPPTRRAPTAPPQPACVGHPGRPRRAAASTGVASTSCIREPEPRPAGRCTLLATCDGSIGTSSTP